MSQLIEARRALDRGEWEEARRRFAAAVAQQESPEALEGLGAAAWWLDDSATALDAREKAYRLFREQGNDRGAARMATELGFDFAVFRFRLAVSNGWFQGAHRLLADLGPVPEHAWLALREGELAYHTTADLNRVRTLAAEAQEHAGRLGLLDLEMMGLGLEGLALVCVGEVSDGMRRLDGACAAATAGDMKEFQAIASTLCFMIWGCEHVRDVSRAGQWCDHLMEYCGRSGLRAHLAFCRGHYASVLTARGQWGEAEEQLDRSLQDLGGRIAWTLTISERLGELQRRQGRLDEAAKTFERTHPSPAGLLGTARVALQRGDAEAALDLAERVLRKGSEENRAQRIAPLELLVSIHCARGDAGRAEEALEALETVVAHFQTPGLLALVSERRGQFALAAGHAGVAKRHLEDALDLYEISPLPFEAALARLDLARALHLGGRGEAALIQATKARTALRELGAEPGAARAESLIEMLTAAGGILSPRETEVLGLMTRGMRNQQIADELVVSLHTVRRHVSNILMKLGLPSRTAAVAYALKHHLA